MQYATNCRNLAKVASCIKVYVPFWENFPKCWLYRKVKQERCKETEACVFKPEATRPSAFGLWAAFVWRRWRKFLFLQNSKYLGNLDTRYYDNSVLSQVSCWQFVSWSSKFPVQKTKLIWREYSFCLKELYVHTLFTDKFVAQIGLIKFNHSQGAKAINWDGMLFWALT